MIKKESKTIKLAIPKGRMMEGAVQLLAEAGVGLRQTVRGYRPKVSLENYEAKVLKPQKRVEMLWVGSRDVGFTGADWVAELGADVVELLDTGLDQVKLVAAAPEDLLVDGKLPKGGLVVASEFERLTREWIESDGLDATFVRSYGATEVFPPEDADLIVDLAATGDTLRANKLSEVATLMTSSTRLYASPKAMSDPVKRDEIERLTMLLRSVLDARLRVMLEVNVPAEKLESVVEVLPCMREPTMSPLHGGAGYAVKAAVPRDELPRVIPEIKRRGGTDIVVTSLSQIMS
jgi:ATP phosphoribosyltransferase